MANEHSQIVPSMQPTAKVADFKFWCQKVLPLVYDDSLSYYEVLNKMVVYLNQVIDNINADIDNVAELEDDFLLLQQYVNNFFDDIDQLVTYTERAEAAQTAAATSAINAASSASNAATSAVNAASSSGSAATSALSALDAKDAAVAAKTAAEAALANAQTAAINAAASATAAGNSADAASGSAINAAASAASALQNFQLSDAARIAAQSAASDAESNAEIAETYGAGTVNGYIWHNFEVGKTLKNDGTTEDAEGICTSEKIPVTWTGSARFYTGMRESSDLYIVFYAEDDSVIQTYVAPNPITVPYRNASIDGLSPTPAYVRFSFNENYDAYVVNNQALNGIRYWSAKTEKIYGVQELSLDKKGDKTFNDKIFGTIINCLRNSAYINDYGNDSLSLLCSSLNINGWLDFKGGQTLTAEGAVSGTDPNRAVSNYLDVEGYTTFIACFDDLDDIVLSFTAHCYDSNKDPISRISPDAAHQGLVERTIPANTKYIRFMFINTLQDISNITAAYNARIMNIVLSDGNNTTVKKYCLTKATEIDP